LTSRIHAPGLAVVEDDVGLCDDLVDFLCSRGFDARGYHSAEALQLGVTTARLDLVVLDVLLPGADGVETARWLHRTRPDIGIVMLTSLDSTHTQVDSLTAGADAYLAKNASLDVIEATCRAVLRRRDAMHAPAAGDPAAGAPAAGAPVAAAPAADHWTLTPHVCLLTTPAGTRIAITPAEAAFLRPLFERAGTPVERSDLLASMGKQETLSSLRNLDNCVRRLRGKVRHAAGLEFPIRPSYGLGYLFAAPGSVVPMPGPA
jgi:DNA-binding response OmpR family regulator